MKDEIKEILKEIYDIQVRYTKPLLKRNYTDKDYIIERYEKLVFKIKNIITNLQEENEKLNYILNSKFADICKKEMIDKLSAVEMIVLQQQRIDKAMEYINKFWKNKSYYEDIDNCMEFATMNEWNKNDLLNILQGSDKGEK